MLSAWPGALERHGGHEVEDAVGQELVEAGADARQHPSAQHVEAAGEGKGRKRDQRKADQGGDAPAGQHAVIDLEHVDGARERQNVDDRGEYGDASKRGKARLQSVLDLCALFPVSRCLLHIFFP